jgi:hypothetical protein
MALYAIYVSDVETGLTINARTGDEAVAAFSRWCSRPPTGIPVTAERVAPPAPPEPEDELPDQMDSPLNEYLAERRAEFADRPDPEALAMERLHDVEG